MTIPQRITEDQITEYIQARFSEVRRSGRIRDLVVFHTTNKYIIMSRDQDGLRALGNIVARYKRGMLQDVLESYGDRLGQALGKRPTVKSHSNVLLHIFGYFSKRLGPAERKKLFGILDRFRSGQISLGEVLAGIAPVIFRLNNTYLASQTYFLLYSESRQQGAFLSMPDGA